MSVWYNAYYFRGYPIPTHLRQNPKPSIIIEDRYKNWVHTVMNQVEVLFMLTHNLNCIKPMDCIQRISISTISITTDKNITNSNLHNGVRSYFPLL
jgi:hypothetical protein